MSSVSTLDVLFTVKSMYSLLSLSILAHENANCAIALITSLQLSPAWNGFIVTVKSLFVKLVVANSTPICLHAYLATHNNDTGVGTKSSSMSAIVDESSNGVDGTPTRLL